MGKAGSSVCAGRTAFMECIGLLGLYAGGFGPFHIIMQSSLPHIPALGLTSPRKPRNENDPVRKIICLRQRSGRSLTISGAQAAVVIPDLFAILIQ